MKNIIVSVLSVCLPLFSFGQEKVQDGNSEEKLREIIEEDGGPGKDVAVTLTTTVLPKYLLTNGFVLYDHSVSQTDLFVAFPKLDLSLDFWHSTPLNGKGGAFGNKTLGEEQDYTIAYNRKVKGFDVELALAYFDLLPVGTAKGDIIQPHVQVSRTFKLNGSNSVTPYVRLEPTFVTADSPYEGGFYAHVGLRHHLDITPALHFDQALILTHDDGVAKFNVADLFRYRAEATLDLNRYFSIGANVVVMSPLNSVSDGRNLEVVPGAFFKLHLEF